MRRLVAGLLLLCITACGAGQSSDIDGKLVQRRIDETITPSLLAYDRTLTIAPAVCLPHSKQVPGQIGTCTLRVNNVPLEVRVMSAQPPEQFSVNLNGVFFTMPYVENVITRSMLEDYHLRASADCGSPRVRLIAPAGALTCKLTGVSNERSIRVAVSAAGQLVLPRLPGFANTLDRPLAAHAHSGKSVVSGADVIAMIDEELKIDPHATAGAIHIRCPKTLDLTNANRAICFEVARGANEPRRLWVWIDDQVGLRVQPIDAMVDRKHIEQQAQNDLNRRLHDGGFAPDALVHCEPGILVGEPPLTFECPTTSAGKRYRLVVTVQDPSGTMQWNAVPQ